MLPSDRPNASKRWPRGQKFSVSPAGSAADEAYRAAVLAARASGRAALDAALAAWATARALAPADGVLLGELSGKNLRVSDLCDALEPAGIAAEEVRAGLGRLVAGGMVDALPLRSQLEERPPYYRG